MWTQGYVGYLCIPGYTNICYLVIAGVQSVTLPPPPPPPPPSLGIESSPPALHPPSVNGKGRSALLSSIQTFSKGRLKKAEINDRSNPHIWATVFRLLSSYHVQFVLGSFIRGVNLNLQECSEILQLDCNWNILLSTWLQISNDKAKVWALCAAIQYMILETTF